MLGFGLGLNKWRRIGGGGFVGLLDLYPNAAAAYSLRKLRAAYSGSAVRVRKEVSSVSSETDIGFAADGSLDTVSLLAFASDADSGDVFVVTWYDQSLSNDATQGTAASQPKIVSGGSLVTENGKAAIDFDGVDDLLDMGQTIDLYSLASEWSVFMDAKIIDYSLEAFQRIIINDSSNTSSNIPFGIQLRSNNDVAFFNNGTVETNLTLSSATQRTLFSFIKRSGDVLIGINGSSTTSTKGSVDFTAGLENTTIGCSPNGSNRPANMKSAELIIYPSDQSANRTGIETNINTFYSIYP